MRLKSKIVIGLATLLSSVCFSANTYATAAPDITDDYAAMTVEPVSSVSYVDYFIPNENMQYNLPILDTNSPTERRTTPDIHCRVSTISVSSLKVTWDAIKDHTYQVSCYNPAQDYEYNQNIYVKCKTPDSGYITGLRENTAYVITVKDLTTGLEESTLGQTERVEVVKTYDYIPGWTNCFTSEAASGLTRDPSKSAIAGAISDPVTDTGIMRDEYGDYCVAMGLYFGRCGDRFLVELENGTQFTVKICDSKGLADDGEGKYHIFGYDRSGKSVVEFIHGSYLPECVQRSGNYGSYDWDGLKFDNIKSICKIKYGNTVTY